MKSELVINVGPFENRLALLENNKLVELAIHRTRHKEIVGNIYKGIVKDNVPGMGATFIDIGLDRTALLHFRDAVPNFLDNEDLEDESVIKDAENDIYKMGELLEVGHTVMVQVVKAPLGRKGARLTGEISIPGRYMVYIPNKSYIAVSRKIVIPKERRRLKEILGKIRDNDVGIIVRTNAEYHTEKDFKKEYINLKNTWQEVQEKYKDGNAPQCIYDENDLTSTTIRYLINKNIDCVIVDSKSERGSLIKRLKKIAPEMIKKIKLYKEESGIFSAFGIEKEISKIFRYRIYLESGGFIVIQQTEALVSIDVNTGGFVGDKNLEDTVTTTNLDAAREIARQIRLQDLSGMIIIDFIDMQNKANYQKVLRTFRAEMSKDYSPHKIFATSPLNLIEMTRKRARANLLSSFFENCPCCQKIGRVLARSSIIDSIFIWLNRAERYHPDDELEIHIHHWVNEFIVENQIPLKKDYHFSYKFVVDNELAHSQFKVISLRSKKDITYLYKI